MKGWLVDLTVGGLVGGLVGAVAAVNFVIYTGIEQGYEASLVYGIGAPKGTPPDIIERLNREINAGLADPKIKARLAAAEGLALTGSAADFGKLLTEETEKWGKVVKFAKLKPR